MAGEHWRLKENVILEPEDVARIACALKSLAVYTTIVCEQDNNPEELKRLVDEGLATMEKLFDY